MIPRIDGLEAPQSARQVGAALARAARAATAAIVPTADAGSSTIRRGLDIVLPVASALALLRKEGKLR
jgi:hypothetical protein